MRISLRLIIALTIVATLPLIISGVWSLHTLQQANALATAQSETAMTELGEETIRQQAKAVAREVELYISAHPEVSLGDNAQLEAEPALAKIGVQPVGQTGYTAVFDEEGVVHFHANPKLIGVNMRTLADELPEFWAIYAASLDGSLSEGYYDWKDADGQIRPKYMSIVPVGDTRLRLAATTYIDEFSQPVVELKSQLADVRKATGTQLLLALLSVTLVASTVAVVLGRWLSRPIHQIADAAARVAAGDLSPVGLGGRRDEIGILAQAFDRMTVQLRGLFGDLEQRTHDLEATTSDLAFRSQELEVANVHLEEARQHQEAINRELQEANERTRRRAAQLQAVAEVGRAITQVRDVEQLLPQIARLISQHFGFYHTGIFLVDEAARYAVLRAASSEGGGRMLARNHKLAVGEQSLVGYVTATGEPRVALDVGADAVHLANPDLPETRSEATLPLQVGGRTIGALDMQSVKVEVFDNEDVAVLSTLADQVAIAIENARLFQQSQEALAEAEQAQRRYLQQAWQGFLQQRPDTRFEYTLEGVPSALDVELPITKQAVRQGELVAVSEVVADGDNDAVARAALSVPIKLRGQVIGVLDLHEADEARIWTEHEIALAQAVADQMAQALEAARLFEQTQERAQREQLVSQITTHMRAAPNVGDILRVASEELGRALGVTRSVVRLRPQGEPTQHPENP